MLKMTILFFSVFCNLALSGQIFAEDKEKYSIIVPTHFKTIKEAIENAKPGDTILIKEGIYKEKEGFSLKSGLRLEGKGADKTIVKIGPQGITKGTDIDESDKIVVKVITKGISNESVRLDGGKEPDKVHSNA